MDRKPDPNLPLPSPMLNTADRRAAVQLAEQERAQARSKALESQSSSNHGPRERILIWERLHELRLPLAAAHPLVALIASQTHLSVRDVRDEQARRRQPLGTQEPAHEHHSG